ncbi:MAG: hypothetical protein RSD11_09385 [Bacteroides sp.]|uniref:hypothetical protein n=1 Tax=Bacteroides sp. TaxID=29523 RepID=UPI002FCA488C
MEKISFSLLQIIEETKTSGERFMHPDIPFFNLLEEETKYIFENNYYEVTVLKGSDYIWMTFNYGNPNPRDEKVTNIETSEKRDNDRKENEVELLSQLFVLYDNTRTLYLSNSKKKKLLETFLKDKLQANLIIKNFYKTEAEIIDMLKDVSKIEFTHTKDIFSDNSKQKQALRDLTGVDAPEKFTIEAEYKRSNPLTNWIKQLFDAKTNQQISNLVICGRNESNFNFIYNADTFSRKIDICCNREANGKFKQECVLEELLKNLTK